MAGTEDSRKREFFKCVAMTRNLEILRERYSEFDFEKFARIYVHQASKLPSPKGDGFVFGCKPTKDLQF